MYYIMSTCTGSKTLSRIFALNIPRGSKDDLYSTNFVAREVYASQLPTQTVVTYIGMSNYSFQPQAAIIFSGDCATKIDQLVRNIEFA